MRIDLLNLEIRNFKGISKFSLTLDGLDATVSGQNGTGKTTVYDAFTWLLTGKDSLGKGDFDIRPRDTEGNPIHALDCEVEGTFLIGGGRRMKMRKLYREIWATRHGESDPAFDGNETLCWIDDVPVKKGEYDRAIGMLIDNETLRLLTNTEYFLSNGKHALDWKKRRRLLLEIAGQVSDDEVISANSTLKGLAPLLTDKTIDDLKKMNAEKIKRHNKELADIRPRIDERMSMKLPDAETAKKAELEDGVKLFQAQLEDIEKQLASGNVQGEEANRLGCVISRLTADRDARRLMLEATARAERGKLEMKNMEKEQELERKKTALNYMLARKIEAEGLATELEAKRAELLKKYHAVNSSVFNAPEIDENCQFCGQRLPEDMLEGQLDELRNKFAEDKKKDVAAILDIGKSVAAEMEKAKERLKATIDKINAAEEEIAAIEPETAPELPPFVMPDFSSDEKIKDFESQIKEAREQLEKTQKEDAPNDNTGLIAQRKAFEKAIAESRATLSKIEESEKNATRIEELEGEERRIAKAATELEKIVYLSDLFVAEKAKMLQNKVNSMFENINFHMFETQVNGGIAECCEAFVGGVSYNSSLNLAAKINAGLEAINVLSGHYNSCIPIFVDQVESVNEVAATVAQRILLKVTGAGSGLNVDIYEKSGLTGGGGPYIDECENGIKEAV